MNSRRLSITSSARASSMGGMSFRKFAPASGRLGALCRRSSERPGRDNPKSPAVMPPATPIKSVASPRIRPVRSVSARPGPIKRSWIVRHDWRPVAERWGRCILVHRRWGVCVDVRRWAAIGGRWWWCGRRTGNVSGFRPAKAKTSHRNRCDHSMDNMPKMATHCACPLRSFCIIDDCEFHRSGVAEYRRECEHGRP
jgi:hypothetical protein